MVLRLDNSISGTFVLKLNELESFILKKHQESYNCILNKTVFLKEKLYLGSIIIKVGLIRFITELPTKFGTYSNMRNHGK